MKVLQGVHSNNCWTTFGRLLDTCWNIAGKRFIGVGQRVYDLVDDVVDNVVDVSVDDVVDDVVDNLVDDLIFQRSDV